MWLHGGYTTFFPYISSDGAGSDFGTTVRAWPLCKGGRTTVRGVQVSLSFPPAARKTIFRSQSDTQRGYSNHPAAVRGSGDNGELTVVPQVFVQVVVVLRGGKACLLWHDEADNRKGFIDFVATCTLDSFISSNGPQYPPPPSSSSSCREACPTPRVFVVGDRKVRQEGVGVYLMISPSGSTNKQTKQTHYKNEHKPNSYYRYCSNSLYDKRVL